MGYILDTIRGKNDPDRESDPRYIGDYGIGKLIRKGSAWGLDQLTFGAVDALTEEVDKYGNLRFKKPGASDAANFYIRALPNVSPPVIKEEKKEQPDYEAIITESQLPGNSLLHRPKLQDTFTAAEIWGPGSSPPTVFESIIDNYKPSLPELPDEGTPKPVIPKSTKYIEDKLFKGQSGYKTIADYKANVLNKIPWETKKDFYGQVWRNLQEGKRFAGYAEHKISKSSEKGREIRYNELADKGSVKPIRDEDISWDMDWYHDETYYDKPWHKGGTLRSDGLNKGDRNRFENMILGFNPRLKTVKDQVEPIVYGTMINPGPGMLNPDLTKRIIVTVEDPQENIAREDRTNLGRIVLQRAGDDKVVGYIGQHWDAFYPYDPEAKDILINGLIERGYINNPSELGDWRQAKLRERINFIIEQAPDLNQIELDKGSATRQKILEAALRKDLVEFRKEFGWIPVQKNLKRKLNTEFSQEGYGWLKQDIPPESIKTKPKESPIKSWHDPSIKERHTYGGYIRRSKQPRTAKEWLEKLFPRQFEPADDE